MQKLSTGFLGFTAAVLLGLFANGSAAFAAQDPPHDVPSAGAQAPNESASTRLAKVLDQDVPPAERAQALADIEHRAEAGNQHDMYMLGSLYHMGDRVEPSLIGQDMDKASLYLGNAATRGSILAMAKMAEIKLATHQYREAMNWAQLYAHYESLVPKSDRPRDGYAAELVKRIVDKWGQRSLSDVMNDVNSFIAQHDAQIQAGSQAGGSQRKVQLTKKNKSYFSPDGRFSPEAGFADYLLVFKPDGTLSKAWLIDAVPDPALGKTLRRYAENMTAPPSDKAGPRYVWVPVMYDDGRYRSSTRR